jgi:Tol biopolymer transport system component
MSRKTTSPIARWATYITAVAIISAAVATIANFKLRYGGTPEFDPGSCSIMVRDAHSLNPDGKRLVFQVVRETPDGTTSEVRWLDLDSRESGSVPMPDADSLYSSPGWASGSDTILLVSSHKTTRVTDPSIRAYDTEAGRTETLRSSRESYALGWFAPSGNEKIVFSQIDIGSGRPGGDLWVMDTSGRNARQITQFGDVKPDAIAISAKGNRVVFVRERGGNPSAAELWIADCEGHNAHRVKQGPWYDRPGIFSRDGTHMMWFDRFANGIDILDLGTGEHCRVARGHTAKEAVWSADGTKIAYVTLEDDLYTVPVDGSSTPRLLAKMFGSANPVAWSHRDGLLILVRNNATIWTVTPDGDFLRQIFPRALP